MKKHVSKLVTIAVIVIAIVGGLFFGLFSCGGYVWHEQLFAVLFISGLLFVLFSPPRVIGKLWKRAFFVVSSSALFLFVRAAASAFYPTAPESWAELVSSFARGLQYGPC